MAGFPETRWSLILRAGSRDQQIARAALGELLPAYAPAVDAYLAGVGIPRDEVPDVRQAFFADLLDHRAMERVERERAPRFRLFLLKAIRYHLSHRWQHDAAIKRGGGQVLLSLDATTSGAMDPAAPSDPEREFRRTLAAVLVQDAVRRLVQEFEILGRSGEVHSYLEFLALDEEPDHARIADRLGITPAASRTRLRRLRRRFREILRECAADTLADPADVDDELRCLLS